MDEGKVTLIHKERRNSEGEAEKVGGATSFQVRWRYLLCMRVKKKTGGSLDSSLLSTPEKTICKASIHEIFHKTWPRPHPRSITHPAIRMKTPFPTFVRYSSVFILRENGFLSKELSTLEGWTKAKTSSLRLIFARKKRWAQLRDLVLKILYTYFKIDIHAQG